MSTRKPTKGNPPDAAYREGARKKYAEPSDCDIEIQSAGRVSRHEDGSGAWVQAWVWVYAEDVTAFPTPTPTED